MTNKPERAPAGLPPHDVSAEEAVLAAILLDDEALPRVLGIVNPADFFRDTNRDIFEAAIAVSTAGVEVTLTTVAHQLATEGKLDAVGGEAFLVELGNKFYAVVGAQAHAAIVARAAHYRRLMSAASEIVRVAHKGGFDENAVQQKAEALVREAGARNATSDHVTAMDIAADIWSGGGARVLVPTHLRALDRILGGGIGLGELGVIGAHTSHAKTAVAGQMALNMALPEIAEARGGKTERVGYITVEGSPAKMVERMAASRAGFTRRWLMRSGEAKPHHKDAYDFALDEVARSELIFPPPDRMPRSISAIVGWITSKARGEGVRVFFIDHIDDVDLEKEPGDSTAGSYRDALRRLQNTATRENIAIVYLSQVNDRQKTEEIPAMHSLRESGAKEELAQLVMMLFLDARQEWVTWAAGHLGAPARPLWMRVDKQTEGETGSVWGPQVGGKPRPPFLLNTRSMGVVDTPHEPYEPPPEAQQGGF